MQNDEKIYDCNLSLFFQILAPFMLRRQKCDVDLCIPPKKEILVYAPLTKEQQDYYKHIVDRTIMDKIDEKRVRHSVLVRHYFRCIQILRPKKEIVSSCHGPKKNRVGRSAKPFFLQFFLVKNVCFMHVLR